MSPHWQEIRASVLRALVPGAILPVVFFLLYSANSHTTARDILPDLNSPLAVIGCFGFVATFLPGFIALALLFGGQQPAITGTAFGSLSFIGQIALCLAINTALWTMPVLIFRRSKRFFSSPDNGGIEQIRN
jgi:hypothetical protein